MSCCRPCRLLLSPVHRRPSSPITNKNFTLQERACATAAWPLPSSFFPQRTTCTLKRLSKLHQPSKAKQSDPRPPVGARRLPVSPKGAHSHKAQGPWWRRGATNVTDPGVPQEGLLDHTIVPVLLDRSEQVRAALRTRSGHLGVRNQSKRVGQCDHPVERALTP